MRLDVVDVMVNIRGFEKWFGVKIEEDKYGFRH